MWFFTFQYVVLLNIWFYLTVTEHYLPIHREAPAFIDQGTEQEILVTGIKVNSGDTYCYRICFLTCILNAKIYQGIFCFYRLWIFWPLTKEVERLVSLVGLESGRLYLSWSWSITLQRPMVSASSHIHMIENVCTLNLVNWIIKHSFCRWFFCICWCWRANSWRQWSV